jgi:hypothetical protein
LKALIEFSTIIYGPEWEKNHKTSIVIQLPEQLLEEEEGAGEEEGADDDLILRYLFIAWGARQCNRKVTLPRIWGAAIYRF